MLCLNVQWMYDSDVSVLRCTFLFLCHITIKVLDYSMMIAWCFLPRTWSTYRIYPSSHIRLSRAPDQRTIHLIPHLSFAFPLSLPLPSRKSSAPETTKLPTPPIHSTTRITPLSRRPDTIEVSPVHMCVTSSIHYQKHLSRLQRLAPRTGLLPHPSILGRSSWCGLKFSSALWWCEAWWFNFPCSIGWLHFSLFLLFLLFERRTAMGLVG